MWSPTIRVTAVLVSSCFTMIAASLGAQRAAYHPARTPWGDPDLQGIWPSTQMVGVPFERPAQFGSRLYLTDDELRERQKQSDRQQQLDVADFDADKPSNEVVAMGDVGGMGSAGEFKPSELRSLSFENEIFTGQQRAGEANCGNMGRGAGD